MLLAAGRGERLRPLTDTMPKALVDVAGSSLIERHLRSLAAAGVDTVVVNTGWLGERISEQCGGGSRYGLQIIYSPEHDNVLETGGGIVRALPLLGQQPFWVINADIVTDWTPPEPRLADDALAHIVLVANPDYRDNGDFDLRDGRVRNSAIAPLTYSGIACYSPEFFRACKPTRFSVAPLLMAAADNGTLSGEIHEGLWADVGTPERLNVIDASLRRQASAEA